MHFEVLVEDQSGCAALDILLEKMLGRNHGDHSWRTHAYKGLGHIPRNLHASRDPSRRLLLSRLPELIRGYGNSLGSDSSVIVVVDLDDRDCTAFKNELLDIVRACDPRPTVLFRIAIEESEAWLLGDQVAVKAAYPRAREPVLSRYLQDSICGTWEVLADAVHPGGSADLKKLGWGRTGAAKREWATRIAPHMDPDRNISKSFQVFRDGVRHLAGVAQTGGGR